MKTELAKIPIIQKVKIEKNANADASSCCTPKNNADVCCTPGKTEEENNGGCCVQPGDGSACCNK